MSCLQTLQLSKMAETSRPQIQLNTIPIGPLIALKGT